MLSDFASPRDIRPTSPASALHGLLTLVSARVLPLSSGGCYSGYTGDQSCCLVAAMRGTVTVSSYAGSDVLSPGPALALHQCGAFTVQSVGDGVCMLLQLQGELPGRLLTDWLTDGTAFFPKGGAAVREAVLSLAVLEEECALVSGNTASAYAYTMLTNLISGPTARQEEGAEGPLPPLMRLRWALSRRNSPSWRGWTNWPSGWRCPKPI